MTRMNWDRVSRERRPAGAVDDGSVNLDGPLYTRDEQASKEHAVVPAHQVAAPVPQGSKWRSECRCGWTFVGRRKDVELRVEGHLSAARFGALMDPPPPRGHEEAVFSRADRRQWTARCTCGATFGPARRHAANKRWREHQASAARSLGGRVR